MSLGANSVLKFAANAMLNLYINDFNFVFRLEIVLVIHSGQHSVRVVCSELTHLENYTQPHAPGKVNPRPSLLANFPLIPSLSLDTLS